MSERVVYCIGDELADIVKIGTSGNVTKRLADLQGANAKELFVHSAIPGGKNEEAARYSGINTDAVIVSAYAICGILTAISAVFFAMYTRSISPSSHGNFYELYAIAAAVLGGFSLRGGEGSIIGVVLGAVLLQVLQNLVNLLGIPSSLNFAVMGTVILIGVLVDSQLPRIRGFLSASEQSR